jgi:hypothetical protein
MFLYAQEEDEEGDSEYDTDWDGYISELYSKGDQTFTISLGTSFPVVFINNGKAIDHHIKPPVGGTGLLGYTYFFNSHFFVGADIGVQIFYTVGKNTLFLVPVGLRTGWQFLVGRFEFPVGLTVGLSIQRYLDNNYLGLFIRGGPSAYFRFNPDWSFGLSTDWSWFPQWPKENGERVSKKDMYANTLGVSLAARYHF